MMASRHSSVGKNSYSNDISDDATYVDPPAKGQRMSTKFSKTENVQEGGRRRGRRPSQKPCLNHNAQMARRNREKKKQYLEHLETQINKYAEETQHYKEIIHKKTITERRLEAEVAYLKSVINNKSNIKRLLQSLNESLQKNTVNSAHTPSSQNQRITEATEGNEAILPGQLRNREVTLTETYGMGLTNQLSPDLGFDYTSQLILPDEDPFLISSEEGFDSQLPITPESIEDNSSEVFLGQNKLNVIDNINSIDIENFANSCQVDEANTLDFEATTGSLLEDNCLQNLDSTAGICLHINSSRVSLEFCSSCQRNSLYSEKD